jgi:uncharacterized protein (DUF488 family)
MMSVMPDPIGDHAGKMKGAGLGWCGRLPIWLDMRIFTIGYEGATQPELVATLVAAGVRQLIDVRAVPLSRRPGFSKNVLANGLREAGIDYVNLKALGTPPEGREAARRGKHDVLERVYAGQLELPEAIAQGQILLGLAAEKPSALLCFERDPGGCHRTLLLHAIAADAEVIDLFVPALPKPAAA